MTTGKTSTLISDIDEYLLAEALKAASHTRTLVVEPAARHAVRKVFEAEFGSAQAIIVADENSFAAAGRDVVDSFSARAAAGLAPFIFGPHVYAESRCVEELETHLRTTEAIPVAVGSGTVNDLTKLAAHRTGR